MRQSPKPCRRSPRQGCIARRDRGRVRRGRIRRSITAMNHLSGMDASFLYLETPEMPMHVGSMQILDLPAGYKGDFYEDAKAYLGARMHLADVFQRKLELMPFELANPVWVDEDDLDLDYHVRHVILPRPGTREQLERYVARLHSSLLDRSRPL